MAEPITTKRHKRVVFSSGKQYLFLLRVKKRLNANWPLLADKIKVHQRTLNDWKREKYLMSLIATKRLSRIAKIRIPKNIVVKEPFWYVHKGAKLGAINCFKKYGRVGGDPEYRKKKWHEWWEREGKHKCVFIGKYKPVCKPKFSKDLAEFVGIVMGDGGITKSQIMITLHSKDDVEYALFTKQLAEKLFRLPMSIYKCKNQLAVRLTISRKRLIEFFIEKLELKIGDKLKQGLDIPQWIQKNPKFQKACLKGLIDTDGCIFNECHKINGKIYSYKRLNFSSKSPELRKSVFLILQQLNLNPKMRNDRSVQLENKEKISGYFKIIGSNNPKHKRRFMEEYG